MAYTAFENKNEVLSFIDKLIWLVIFATLSVALVLNSNSLLTVAVLISLIYVVVAKLENLFPFICGISMFETVFKIQEIRVWFLLLLIFSVKAFFKNEMKVKTFAFFSCLIVVCLEFMGDLHTTSIGQLIVNISCIVFVFSAFSNASTWKIKAFDILFSISCAFLGVITYVLVMEGGVTKYITAFMEASHVYRFGSDYGDTVGGAMAIPLYASQIVAVAISFLLLDKNKGLLHKVFAMAIVPIALLVGAMTISRSFYLCILISLVLFVLLRNQSKTAGKVVIPLVIVCFIVAMFYLETDIANKVFDNLQIRLDAGMEEGTAGRMDIWRSCLSYLYHNPWQLLFGSGTTNYPQIGEELGTYFSAGAHNFVIDLLMSWGLVGTVLVVATVVMAMMNIIKRIKNIHHHSWVPFFCFFAFSMTALRSNSMKAWVFMLMTYVIAIGLNTEENYDT